MYNNIFNNILYYNICRFHKEKSEGELIYRNLIMLYYPWRDEEVDLKAGFQSFEDHFEYVEDTIRANESVFSQNAEEIDRAFNDLERMGPPENVWDSVAPNVQYQNAQHEDQGVVEEREVGQQNEQNENVDLGSTSTSGNQSELHARYSAQLAKTLMTVHEYRAMMRSLNDQQLQVLKIHRKWCKDSIVSLKRDLPTPVYQIFLSGAGGVGKSHIIKLVYYETMKLLKMLSGHFEPDELPILLTAFTGTAAFGIEGMTLHSALGLSCGPNSKSQYQPASNEKLNTLRSRLGKLKLLVIDEVSMVGADLLYHIHRRLQDITGRSDRFGGVSILAVGDLFQLQPVGQNHVFGLPSDR